MHRERVLKGAKMIGVLLIWEKVGDDCDLYYIPNVSKDDLDLLKKANGQYINSTADSTEANIVSDYLASNVNYCEDVGNPDNCKWSKYNITAPLIVVGVTHIFRMGFIL
jgi:hypothetical protein